MDGALGELFARRLPVNFDRLLRSQHQPTFFYSGSGVCAELGAIVLVAAQADFDDEFSRVGMGMREISQFAAHSGKVGFWLRIHAGDRLLGANEGILRHGQPENFAEQLKEVGVKG